MEFAPYQTTGAFRSIYFAKYLNDFGINPIVITLSPENNHIPLGSKLNKELLDIIPSDINIYRCLYEQNKLFTDTFIGKLKFYFKINDRAGKRWKKDLFAQLPDIVKEYNPTAVYVSSPPFSAGSIARNISKEFNLPLLLDMRDAWSHWCVSPFATYLHFYFTFLSEKRAFKAASKIVTVTDELCKIFRQKHKEIPKNIFNVIPNGFDIETIPAKLNFKGIKDSNSKINIAYVGSYYYDPTSRRDAFNPNFKKKFHKRLQYFPVKEDWLYRSPYFFLKT